jgi:hypothetical protein
MSPLHNPNSQWRAVAISRLLDLCVISMGNKYVHYSSNHPSPIFAVTIWSIVNSPYNRHSPVWWLLRSIAPHLVVLRLWPRLDVVNCFNTVLSIPNRLSYHLLSRLTCSKLRFYLLFCVDVTLSLYLREENRMRVIQNMVQRVMFGSTRDSDRRLEKIA